MKNIFSLSTLLLLLPSLSLAAPVINGSSGQYAHGQQITITGSGFGDKEIAAPKVWDDCSGTDIRQKWDGGWPSSSANATNNIGYRAPIRGIGLPHKFISKYLAGSHAENGGAAGGYNVMVWKNRTITYPSYTYASWYQRSDDNWTFGGDDNYKVFDYSIGNAPYNLPYNWYIEYNPRPTSRTSGAAWHLNDDTTSLIQPDANGHKWWWNSAVNPMSGKWTKIEVEIKYSTQNDGYIKLWENGAQKINYVGRTDSMPGSARSEAIGGYTRTRNANNWRYFADLYLDHSRARIIIGNAARFSDCTTREAQVPTAWADRSISFQVNQATFSAGTKAFLYVVEPNGTVNELGYPVVIEAEVPTPEPPPALPKEKPTAPKNLILVER